MGDEAAGTATYCNAMNDAFDMLNSRNPFLQHGKYGIPLRDTSADKLKQRANEIETYLWSLKDHNGKLMVNTNRKNCIHRFPDLLQKHVPILHEALREHGISYLLMYKITQDHVDNFFSCIHMRGGFSNNPNCHQCLVYRWNNNYNLARSYTCRVWLGNNSQRSTFCFYLKCAFFHISWKLAVYYGWFKRHIMCTKYL